MATCEVYAKVEVEDVLDSVPPCEEVDFLREVLDRFCPENINAALREHFGPLSEQVTEILDCVDYFEEERTLRDILDCVDYFEEERILRDILERFDVHNINAALREYFGLQTRDKIPDFVDAEKL